MISILLRAMAFTAVVVLLSDVLIGAIQRLDQPTSAVDAHQAYYRMTHRR